MPRHTKSPGSRDAKAAHGARTRDLLIDTTITCIAERGYGGATTDLIAKTANTTRGPLQYYFTDRLGLITAAFERLQQRILDAYRVALDGSGPINDKIDQLLDVSYAICCSVDHYALIEIIIASRSDPDLAARIAPLLASSNAAIDRTWRESIADSNAGDSIVTARYFIVAVNRGLALNQLTFSDPELFEREFALLRSVARTLFEPSDSANSCQ